MTTSSRTPEGSPNCCPVCQNVVHVETSRTFGDAPCPRCGTLLWFFSFTEGTQFFVGDEADEIRKLIAELVEGPAEASDNARQKLQAFFDRYADKLGFDSISLVELMMELEEHHEP